MCTSGLVFFTNIQPTAILRKRMWWHQMVTLRTVKTTCVLKSEGAQKQACLN